MVIGAFTLFLAVAGSFASFTFDLRLQNDSQCQKEGSQCSSDRTHIIYCSGANGTSYKVRECSNGEVCTTANGVSTCGATGKPDVPRNETFLCTGEGAYPDGYRCGTAYMCSSAGSAPDIICECPDKKALILYPTITCTSDESSTRTCLCPYKDRCQDSINPNNFGNCHLGYYYSCRFTNRGYVTDVFKCPDGQIFINGRCGNPVFRSSSTLKLADTSDPKCRPFSATCMPESNVVCTAPGEMLPHSIKRCYYYCTSQLKPELHDCGVGSYFTCKYGPCGCVFGPE